MCSRPQIEQTQVIEIDLPARYLNGVVSYKGDVDLEAKLDEWERFYNFHRPHGAFNGKTPYEALREKL